MSGSQEFAADFLPLVENLCEAVAAIRDQLRVAADGRKRSVPTSDVETHATAAKKQRKEKDPNAPKRPMTSYLLFMRENRKRIVEKHALGNSGFANVTEAVSAEWKSLPSEEKERYEKMYHDSLEVYKQTKQDYDNAKHDAAEVPSSSAATVADAPSKAPISSEMVEDSSDSSDSESSSEGSIDSSDEEEVAKPVPATPAPVAAKKVVEEKQQQHKKKKAALPEKPINVPTPSNAGKSAEKKTVEAPKSTSSTTATAVAESTHKKAEKEKSKKSSSTSMPKQSSPKPAAAATESTEKPKKKKKKSKTPAPTASA